MARPFRTGRQHGRLLEVPIAFALVAIVLALVIPHVPVIGWLVLAAIVIGLPALGISIWMGARRRRRACRTVLARIAAERGLTLSPVIEGDIGRYGHFVGIDPARRTIAFANAETGGTLSFDAVKSVRAGGATRLGETRPSWYTISFDAGETDAPALASDSRSKIIAWLDVLAQVLGERVERSPPD